MQAQHHQHRSHQGSQHRAHTWLHKPVRTRRQVSEKIQRRKTKEKGTSRKKVTSKSIIKSSPMADIAFFSYLSTHCLTATWMSFPSLLTTSVQVFSPERQKHKCQKVKNRETCSAERRSGMHEQYPSNSSPLSPLPRRRVQHPASASVSAWAPHRGRRRRRRKSRRRNLGLAAAPGRFLQTFPRLNHSICSARPRRSRLPKPYPSSEHRAPAIRSVRKEFKGRKDS